MVVLERRGGVLGLALMAFFCAVLDPETSRSRGRSEFAGP